MGLFSAHPRYYASVIAWIAVSCSLSSALDSTVYLAEWPRKSPVIVDLPVTFPVSKPFYHAQAVLVPLVLSRIVNENESSISNSSEPVSLRYTLVSARQSIAKQGQKAQEMFAVDRDAGHVFFKKYPVSKETTPQHLVEWILVLEAGVHPSGRGNASRLQLRVRFIKNWPLEKLCLDVRSQCFANDQLKLEYTIPEVAPAGSMLGMLRPAHLQTVCPEVPRYTLLRVSDPDLTIHGTSSQLSLTRTVRWNETASWNTTLYAKVQCTLGGRTNPKPVMEVIVIVKDLDDQPPRPQSQTSLVCRTGLDAVIPNTKLECPITILDGDSLQANQFQVYTVGDSLNLFEVRTPHQKIFITNRGETFLSAGVYTRAPGATFPGTEYSFNVVVEDVSLVRSDVSSKVVFRIVVSNNSHELREPLRLQDIYNASVSRGAASLTRVLEPMTRFGSGHTFRLLLSDPGESEILSDALDEYPLADGWLNVTTSTGILYVSDGKKLRHWNGTRAAALLEASWDSGNLSQRHRYLVQVRVVEHEDGIPAEDCESRLCVQQLTEQQCVSSCGLGAANGSCHWREGPGGNYLSPVYSTCSGDRDTCPNGFCDELEVLWPNLCPQDCAEHVVGEVVVQPTGRGIKSAVGVCSCAAASSCTCVRAGPRPETRDRVHDNGDAPPTEGKESPQLENTLKPEIQSDPHEEASTGAASPCGLGCLAAICLCGVGLLGFMLAGLLLARRRRVNAKHKYLGPRSSISVNVSYDYVDGRRQQQTSSDAGTQITSAPQLPSSPLTKIVVDSQWEFPRENLVLEHSLGEGEFGKVVRARARDIAGVRGYTTVAVKMLKGNGTPAEEQDLLSEFCMLKEVNHPNVIRLLGGCTTKGGPLFVIVEYAEMGSLLSVLRRSRQLETDPTVVSNPTYMAEAQPGDPTGPQMEPTLTHRDLLCYAWQIAKGMAYLADMKMVHRDLAARNILLASGNVIKISDFGLSRDVYEGDTYLKKSRGRVPVKWMALESLEDHIYTSKSDVWSFGVVLWEIVTLGATPYPGVGPEYLFQLLKAGYRMHQPEECTTEIYRMMLCCWQRRPHERPSFKELTQKLERILQDSASYLDLNLAQHRSYYNLNVESHPQKMPLEESCDDEENSHEAEYGRIEFEPGHSFCHGNNGPEESVGLLMKATEVLADSPVACWIARPETLSRKASRIEQPKQLL